MPTLPQRLRKPHPWLGLVLLLAILFVADIFRPPEKQLSSKAYRSGVSVYQWGKPKCGFAGCCRYSPTCSRYSVEAVQNYGLVAGLDLTVERLRRCRTNVPLGTPDPVPAKIEQ